MKKIHCSTLERRYLCPGSYNAEDGLPDKDSPEAAIGRKIHKALAGMNKYLFIQDYIDKLIADHELNSEQEKIFRIFFSHVEKIKNRHGGIEVSYAEELHENDNLTGTADLIFKAGDGTWHIIDYKTGYGEVEPADRNKQLFGYVVLFQEIYKYERIYGHILSYGNEGEDRITEAEFGPSEIEAAKSFIMDIVKDCIENKPDVRVSSKTACQYCRACGNPERCQESLVLPVNVPMYANALTPAVAAQCAEIYDRCAAAEVAINSFKEWARGILETQPDALPGLQLKPGQLRREITDAQKAFELGMAAGIWTDASEFLRAVTVKISVIQDMAKEAKKGVIKVTQIKDYVNEMFCTVIQTKKTASKLVRTNE